MYQRIKYILVGIALALLAVGGMQFVSANDSPVTEETLQEETEDALRAENQQIDAFARELHRENQSLKEANQEMTEQLILYQDDNHQMSASLEAIYYLEENDSP